MNSMMCVCLDDKNSKIGFLDIATRKADWWALINCTKEWESVDIDNLVFKYSSLDEIKK